MVAKNIFVLRGAAIVIAAFLLTPSEAWALHKCKQANGTISYSETPCESSGSQSLGPVKIDVKPSQSVGSNDKSKAGGVESSQNRQDNTKVATQNASQCQEGQERIDKTVFDLKSALASRLEKEARVKELNRQIDASNAQNIPVIGGSNAVAVHRQELQRMEVEIGKLRYKMTTHLQLFVPLCQNAGIKLNVTEAHAVHWKELKRD
jgi:hypothetical protein